MTSLITKFSAAALALAASMSMGAASVQAVGSLGDTFGSAANLPLAGSLFPSEEYSQGQKANAEYVNKLSDADMVAGLKSGGLVVFFRHAQTEKDYADQAQKSTQLDDCSTQRVLSEAGWKQSRGIGEAFRALNIPVGKVHTSQYCRAWQTGELAFGKYEKTAALNFAPAESYTEAQVKQMRDGLVPLLSAKPAAGTNTVIISHDDVFEAATGIYPEPQGTAYIARPGGDGTFELLNKYESARWTELATSFGG